MRITCLGGGTGTFTVLSGLKKKDVSLSAVVSIADSGGSTGILRDELGVLPPGDIRQCLVALSEASDDLRQLLNYRFHEGGLSGHHFGNLLLSALEKVSGDSISAVNKAHSILSVRGKVVPVSGTPANLYAELKNGKILEGEDAVDRADKDRGPIRRCFLSPSVQVNPEAIKVILNADVLVIGPGDLYTSLIPVLLVEGVKEAIRERTGKTVFVMNLMTRPGHAISHLGSSFLNVLNQYLLPGSITDVILNTERPPEDLLGSYVRVGELLVENDLEGVEEPTIHPVQCLASDRVLAAKGDGCERSLVRHDPDRLAEAILDVARKKNGVEQ